jgi:glutamate-1-semialdehyde aminotransferase
LLAVMEAARRHGALFILDEVKTGLRAPGGSMQALYGVAPDMTTLSKALGNGWPVGAVIGPRAVMAHASGMHLSATYHGDTAAMAAAIATLRVSERDGAQEAVWALGQRLIEGLEEAARRNRFPAEAYGEPIPPMPFLRFTHPDPERNERLKELVHARVMAEGILLHPRHMWFVSAAHSAADIDRVVEAVDAAMHAVTVRWPELLVP